MKLGMTLLSFCLYLIFPNWYLENIISISGIQLILLILLFLQQLGEELGILDILPIMALLFYLLAPALHYHIEGTIWYEGDLLMPIASADYFRVAIPGTLALLLGVYLTKNNKNQLKQLIEDLKEHVQNKEAVAYQFMGVGLFCFLFKSFVPSAFTQLFVFGTELILIGGLYLFFIKGREFLSLLIMLGFLSVKALEEGMFGQLVVWGMLLPIFYFLKHNWSFSTKLLVFSIGLSGIILIHSVKKEYRLITWEDSEQYNSTNRTNFQVFYRLLKNKIYYPADNFNIETWGNFLDRINQGYLTAAAIEHTPRVEPFAKGETIFLATLGAFIPRLCWPTKPEAGGKANIARFTSLEIEEGTSMNIGQLGDAYVNFGTIGGAFFLFIYSFFAKGVLFDQSLKRCHQQPSFIFWLPFIFSTTIIVETDILLTFNHMVKAVVFIGIVHLVFEKLLGIKL